ncbi:hypothetical protein GPALN_003010 [Globodera pallida]|nr:hypothetical protein GPALN_003010 [Globodera pallida]
MHQIPLLSIILLSLLLLITTVVSVTVEVIEDGTPEGPDMAKALALSKRFFWRNMMANWSHYNDYEAFATPKEIGKISKKELAKLNVLKDLRQALAADAYVKCWECKQTNANDEAGSSSFAKQSKKDQFKCLCVKPKFLVEKGELQLSSAMEAIKSVYRDLFRWGQGSGLSFKMSFVNQKAWDLVHRWQLSYANGNKLAANILLKVNEQLGGDEYLEHYESAAFSDQFSKAPSPAERSDALSLSKSILASMNEIKYEETMPNGEKRDYLTEYNAMLAQAKMFNDLPKKIKKGKAEQVDLNSVVEMYQKYWELVQEFGLGMTEMCEGATKLEKMHDSTRLKFVEILKAFGRLFLGKSNSNDGPPEQRIEELSGTLFWRLRRMVRDMMLQMNHGNKLKPVLPDPCEEAKFKVKKTGKPPSSSH